MVEALKQTKQITEIVGYKTSDGSVFKTAEEAAKYEESAKNAIRKQFQSLMIDEPFAECSIFENFGYGSEEYMFCVIDIKDANDLKIVTMYSDMVNTSISSERRKFTPDMIGKRILIELGREDDPICLNAGTYEELVAQFAKETEIFFKKKGE